MKLWNKRSFINFLVYLYFIIHALCFESSGSGDNDPFKSLGIPDLNPKVLLEDFNRARHKAPKTDEIPKLKSIEDLPKFLKNTKIDEDEAIQVLSRFLLQDDVTLKKYGVVYDQTGFDGIQSNEKISSIGTEERLVQRARSAAKIWVFFQFEFLDYI